jgi:RsiW-degrading membrane proteinase PrsW (M82 family)
MLQTYILLLLAIGPALALLVYYYRQDKAKPEPIGMIFIVYLMGCLSVVAAIALEMLVDWLFRPLIGGFIFISILVKSFIIAGLIEEWLKLFVVRRFVFNHSCFDEVMDGIVYTVVAGLGFATVENVFFVLDGGLPIAITRAFTALPLHALAGGLMGYYIGKAKFAENPEEKKKLFRIGLFNAVMLHGFYDLIVFSGVEYGLTIFIALPVLLIFAFIKLRKLIKQALDEDKIMGRQTNEHQEDLIQHNFIDENFSK